MTQPSSKPYPLSPIDLLDIKVGDVLYIDTKRYAAEFTVTSKGRKYIKGSPGTYKLNIYTGRVHNENYQQFRYSVFRSREDIETYNKYCSDIDEANKYIRNNLSKIPNNKLSELVDFMKDIIEKGA